MIEYMKQRGGERKRRCPVHTARMERKRQAKADVNDADVLDSGISQQLAEITLHERVEHAQHGGNAGKRKHDQAPPPDRLADQIKHNVE